MLSRYKLQNLMESRMINFIVKSEESLLDSSQLDTSSHGSAEDLDDEPQGSLMIFYP